MAELLKDRVDAAVVRELAARFEAVDDGFDGDAMVAGLWPRIGELELKDRIAQIARGIREGLSPDYREALAAVVAVARAEPPVEGFAAWPLASFIELYGTDDPAASLPAMEHVTKRMSCEFAIRPFLLDHFGLAYAQLEAFTTHSDETVRRLPSEGTRPRLPWAMRVPELIEDPRPGLALIERLRHDPSETVRRSVANHLNDVAKDHPALVVDVANRWAAEPATDPKMISHGLRTLVKRGDAGAQRVLGFTTDAQVEVSAFDVSPRSVTMGEHIELTATVQSTGRDGQRLVVDFVIHHVNAAGGLSPKVFKWTNIDLQPGDTRTLTKRRLIQQASTRTYRSGTHVVELQVAGAVVASTEFNVVA